MIDTTNSMSITFDSSIMSVSNTTAINRIDIDDSAQSVTITQG